jgi:hypothetical protein
MSINGAPVMAATVVAVDVGKNTAVLSVTDAARHQLFGPVEFAMTAPAVAAVVERVCGTLNFWKSVGVRNTRVGRRRWRSILGSGLGLSGGACHWLASPLEVGVAPFACDRTLKSRVDRLREQLKWNARRAARFFESVEMHQPHVLDASVWRGARRLNQHQAPGGDRPTFNSSASSSMLDAGPGHRK